MTARWNCRRPRQESGRPCPAAEAVLAVAEPVHSKRTRGQNFCPTRISNSSRHCPRKSSHLSNTNKLIKHDVSLLVGNGNPRDRELPRPGNNEEYARSDRGARHGSGCTRRRSILLSPKLLKQCPLQVVLQYQTRNPKPRTRRPVVQTALLAVADCASPECHSCCATNQPRCLCHSLWEVLAIITTAIIITSHWCRELTRRAAHAVDQHRSPLASIVYLAP